MLRRFVDWWFGFEEERIKLSFDAEEWRKKYKTAKNEIWELERKIAILSYKEQKPATGKQRLDLFGCALYMQGRVELRFKIKVKEGLIEVPVSIKNKIKFDDKIEYILAEYEAKEHLTVHCLNVYVEGVFLCVAPWKGNISMMPGDSLKVQYTLEVK